MKVQYRARFPIVIQLFMWGFSIEWQAPIVRMYPRRDPEAEDSMLIYIGMFDEDD
jgi:hypothetical protein